MKQCPVCDIFHDRHTARCRDCAHYERRIEYVCAGCFRSFSNTDKNFRQNGNFCRRCVAESFHNMNPYQSLN